MGGNNDGLRAVLKCLMVMVSSLWLLMWMIRPTKAWQGFWQPMLMHTTTTAYAAGTYILIYAAPIIFVGVVGALAYHEEEKQKPTTTNIRRSRTKGIIRNNPWTYPMFIRGPLSIVSAAEFVFLAIFLIFMAYSFGNYLTVSFNNIDPKKLHGKKLWHEKLDSAGSNLGMVGVFCLAVLFLPVTRGSKILRLINIPFEHAVKFHIWIATTMLVAWTAHGIVYIVYWIITKQIQELWTWHAKNVSGLSGLLALIIGLVIWVTSLGPVRKRNFELFYYTHHLYVLFILFFGLHVGDKLYQTLLGGTLLFFASRLMRYLQSQTTVDVVSARMLSGETMELVIAKQPNLHYNPASFVFLNLPAVSRLQWHPFTVVSCSSVETDHLALLIKCNGDWTSKLMSLIQPNGASNKDGVSLQLEAAVEGPYGHNMDYLSRYEVIIFIAGGSGISPFISILKDMLHSIQAKQLDPPKEIILIYTVKKSNELCILETISPASICPEFIDALKIDVQAYVTREDGTDLEENPVRQKIPFNTLKDVQLKRMQTTRGSTVHIEPSPNSITKYASQKMRAMAPPLAANGLVEAAVILASFAGYMFLAGLIGRYYMYPILSNSSKTFPRSAKGFLAFLETILSVVVFGGATALLSNFCFKKSAEWTPQGTPMTEIASAESSAAALKPERIHYGRRPDFRAIFSEHTKRTAGSNVGVFACGPICMQEDVAILCHEYRTTMENATYNYHPLNYDL